VRQGCSLWPLLDNIHEYIEQAINECKVYCTGIKVNGMRIQTLRFVDVIAIRAQDEKNLKRKLECLDYILNSNYNVNINWKKHKL
jgi:hypothetical protein